MNVLLNESTTIALVDEDMGECVTEIGRETSFDKELSTGVEVQVVVVDCDAKEGVEGKISDLT